MPDGSAYAVESAPAQVAVRKIAIMGCAATSSHLAPWTDPSYQIWGCSGALQPQLKRPPDAWFELHDLPSCRPLWTAEYWQFLCRSTSPVYLIEPHPEIPASKAFPRDELIAAFGRYFFTSSIAWMMAYALHYCEPVEIALYGIDMAGDGEYQEQRAGCHHFISIALHRGIQVTAPPESSLLNPPPIYGGLRHPLTVQAIGLNDRVKKAQVDAQQRYEAAVRDVKYWEGFGAANDFWQRTLEQDPKSVAGG